MIEEIGYTDFFEHIYLYYFVDVITILALSQVTKYEK